MERRRLEAELGQEHFCPSAERFRRENFPPGGIIIIINNSPILGRAISINIFNITISSQTLVHLLYQIFVPKPHIGACGLLVLLITPCSSCQLVYSVEDHMFRSLMHINTPLIMNMNMLCEQLHLFLRTWVKSCYQQSCEFGIRSIF